jgi:hypothetical protein
LATSAACKISVSWYISRDWPTEREEMVGGPTEKEEMVGGTQRKRRWWVGYIVLGVHACKSVQTDCN